MIVHLDADAFYASVEQATDPRLRGRPVAVGGAKRGVVASASYEARNLGVHTTMPVARARKICPALVVLPGDFEKYERFSRFMFSYAYDFTPTVEVTGIDEGFFDLRGNRSQSPRDIAATIRDAIRQALKIPVSEGIASNKLVSAVASKLKKPACFLEVGAGAEREFLAPLENKWLPGVGPVLAKTLHAAGLARIGQIAATHPCQLTLFAGRGARQLWEFAHGVDARPVVSEAPAAKSWSEQETFEQDVTDEDWILAKLRVMADRLFAKVRAEGRTVRTIEVRIRYNDFDECRRSESLAEPGDLETDAYPLLDRLLRRAWERRVSLRLAGVKLSGAHGVIFQAGLPLVDAGCDPAQRRRLSPVLDQLRAKYGSRAVMRGHDLFLRHHRPAAPPGAPRPGAARRRTHARPEWAALNMKSAFSFLDSLLKPSDAVALAAENGCRAVAITDPNLHGAVEFFMAAKEAGIKPVIAAEVCVDGKPALAYVENAAGYRNLCAALSAPARAARPGMRAGLILRPPGWLPEVRCRDRSEKPMFDLLQSIRTLSLVDRRHPARRGGCPHFPPAEELPCDAADLRDSLEVAERCEFEFTLGGLRFPNYQPPDGASPRAFLRRLAFDGLRRRYGHKPALLPRVRAQVEEELGIIAEVGYEEYFLVTWDILQDCAVRGIEWITRGSAADSLVCYCLGISGVCPVRFDLYFRRFLNRDRMALNKLPDIDVDFAHDRKDDVVDLVFRKYGERAAVVGGFSTYQGRSAFADIAKAMGVSEHQVRRMTEHLPRTDATRLERAVAGSRECADLDFTEDPCHTALRLARRLDGFPRNPKMHPCGVVLARDPIAALTPLFTSAKGRPTTHFNMEHVEAIGLVKMDLLAQGGLAVMRDAKQMLAARGVGVDLEALEPWDNPQVWQMISSGNARGVHHIESPAMCSLERMVHVDNIDDLIAIVSVIRPGAANNLKKEQFSLRAQGLEPVAFAHPSLEPVLRSTYGVVAYEEHILQICGAFAGLPAGRADILRRALVKSDQDKITALGREFAAAARTKGRSAAEIKSVWALVCGFQGYAFCRAHSTAYGVEAYQAAWLKRYHPAEFLAAVLTHGKGFYSRLVYSIECRRLGIGFLPPDVNRSQDAFFPEDNALRVPLRQVRGLSERTLSRWQQHKPYDSLRAFYGRVKPSSAEMDALIRVGAFDALGPGRAKQFWQFRALAQWAAADSGDLLPLSGAAGGEPGVSLTEPSRLTRLRDEMELLGFTVSGHPLDLHPGVPWENYCPIAALDQHCGKRVTIAGLIVSDRIHRQHDGRPMKFLSLCDRTGIIECELFADAYRRCGVETVRHPVIAATGQVTGFPNGNGHTLRIERITGAGGGK